MDGLGRRDRIGTAAKIGPSTDIQGKAEGRDIYLPGSLIRSLFEQRYREPGPGLLVISAKAALDRSCFFEGAPSDKDARPATHWRIAPRAAPRQP